ncbi:MAG: hypothetical protein ABR968_14700 [Bacteroidales bacterium]|jgi:hypothetical protein
MEAATKLIPIKKVGQLNNISKELFPEGAFQLFIKMLEPHDVRIRIKRKRSTKYGDFNPSGKTSQFPVITVNNDLNPYFFLITLLHEFAHYLVWKDGHHYAKPHGRTWKNHFSGLMQTMIQGNIFPERLLPFIIKHIQNPKATSCTDTKLFRELSNFDTNPTGVFIDDLPDGELFRTKDGQVFSREKKRRKMILCTRLPRKKQYLFSPIFKVFPINQQEVKNPVSINL